jgi:hypothetical protein
MELKKIPKIHYATTNDFYSPIMSYVLVTKEDIVATNGHVLVLHKTNNVFEDYFIEQLPDRCLIKNENWKILCKGYYTIEFLKGVNCIKISSKLDTYLINVEFEKDLDVEYFKYNKLFDDYNKGDIDSIGISPKFLYDLSIAMDSKSAAELNFESKEKAIIVKSEHAKGLIMPKSF